MHCIAIKKSFTACQSMVYYNDHALKIYENANQKVNKILESKKQSG